MHFGTVLKFTHQFTKNYIHTLIHTHIHRSFTRCRRTQISHKFSRNFAQSLHKFCMNLASISQSCHMCFPHVTHCFPCAT